MTLEELIKLQADRGLKEHLVYLHEGGFCIAHTDEERWLAYRYPAALPLEDCPLHQWLEYQPDQPAPTGVYKAYENEGSTTGAWALFSLDD